MDRGQRRVSERHGRSHHAGDGPREVDLVADEYGIDDNWPVFCEEFKQWVLEDHFTAGRPALEKVGVQFVPDVAPYEHMKIRILNGGHAAIAYPAALLDIHFVHEAMEDKTVCAFLAKLEQDEIIPVIPPVPNTDLNAYFKKVESRLFNPKIADTIPRLAQDGSNRQPKFILPDDGRPASARRGCYWSSAGVSALVPISCRQHRQRQGNHLQRCQRRPASCRGDKSQGRSTGLSCAFGHLRRCCAINAVPETVRACAADALGQGHAGNAAALSRRKTWRMTS
jgi:hypothetical protein